MREAETRHEQVMKAAAAEHAMVVGATANQLDESRASAVQAEQNRLIAVRAVAERATQLAEAQRSQEAVFRQFELEKRRSEELEKKMRDMEGIFQERSLRAAQEAERRESA